jgi:small-conductance mechanosensitive channel
MNLFGMNLFAFADPAATESVDNAANTAGNVATQAAETVTATVGNSWDAVRQSFENAWTQTIAIAPQIVAMVVVIVLGYVVARFVGKAIATLAEKLGLQNAADQSGLADSMHRMGVQRNVPAIIGTIVFWLLMSVFLMAAFNILGLQAVSEAMQAIVAYIPKLLVATVVIVVGLLLATFLRGVVATSADRVGLTYAEYLANGCYYVFAVLTFIAAFNQLGLQFELLEQLILIGAGALAVGFALAFGLGGRDVMSGILAGYYVRQRLHAGDHVTVGHLEGTVREVGPVATIIETDEDGLLNRRSIPNSKMLNEAVR